jgi:hypothetical protein
MVLELGLPIPADSTWDVALIVGGGVDVNFDEAEIRGIQVVCDPFGRNQNFGVFVLGHRYISFCNCLESCDLKQKTHLPITLAVGMKTLEAKIELLDA